MTDRLAAQFRRFAEQEAHGHSPLYETLCLGIANDRDLLRRLVELSPESQQPNLLLAAARHVSGVSADYATFHRKLRANWDLVIDTMRARRTQTNEPARCAVLLPVLARLHRPLALIEVGAAAGLCLLPDHYAYDYEGRRVGDAAAPVFPCRASDATPIPTELPQIVWRAGLDLNPVDPRDREQVAWLETLVWPDQPQRLERLRAALEVLRQNPVRVRKGDLATDLEPLLREAPVGASVVVFHTAVLGYIANPKVRSEFATMLWDHSAVWISNESPRIFPEIAARASRPGPPGAFLLSVNGQPVAWTDPHGAWIDWLS